MLEKIRFIQVVFCLLFFLKAFGLIARESGENAPDEGGNFFLMPAGLLFSEKIADPGEPGLRVSYIFPNGGKYNHGEAVLGTLFGLLRYRFNEKYALQLDVEGGVFTRFIFRPENSLNNIDYKIGLPVTFRMNKWSVKVHLYHMSSHLGDAESEATGRKSILFSREYAVFLLGYQYGRFRIYGGPAYIMNPAPEVPGGTVQLGVDSTNLYTFSRKLSLYGGIHTELRKEWNCQPNLSLRTGIRFHAHPNRRSLDLGFTVFKGTTLRGQFYTEEESYFSIYLEFRP